MVWGGITERGRTPFAVFNGNLAGICYRDEIVQRYVFPFTQGQANSVTFKQDNARPHVVRDYLTQQHVDVLSWPAVLPDLLPIVHVWDEMELRLRQLQNQLVK